MTLPTVTWNQQFLDRSPNRDDRGNVGPYLGLLLHETASPDPSSPIGTLRYNLSPTVKSSYHVLVDRTGVAWSYLTSAQYVAWHAGVGLWTLPNGKILKDYDLNQFLIGVELDGKNDGTPVTPAQIETAALLAIMYSTRYGFPLAEGYITEHHRVALPPGRKTDPRGTNAAAVVQKAHALLGGC